MPNELRTRFIRETENVIDKLREKMELLLEEASDIEAKITEHREMLQLLKQGIVVDDDHAIVPIAVAPTVTAGPGVPPPEEHENNGRKPRNDVSEEEFLAAARTLGDNFSIQELARHLDQSDSAVRRRLEMFADRGMAKMTVEATSGGHGGRKASRWRVY